MPFATNKGIKIHYEIEGKGEPLILQHGNGGTLDSWHIFGYVNDLNKDHQLILVDARAHGKSDRLYDNSAYTAETVAGDYAAILDDLGIKKAGYWGYSMGGRIGYKCMLRYNLSRMNYMILGGSNPFGMRTEQDKKQNEESLSMLRMAIEKGMEAYIDFFEKGSARCLRRERRSCWGPIPGHSLPSIPTPPPGPALRAFYPGSSSRVSSMPVSRISGSLRPRRGQHSYPACPS